MKIETKKSGHVSHLRLFAFELLLILANFLGIQGGEMVYRLILLGDDKKHNWPRTINLINDTCNHLR